MTKRLTGFSVLAVTLLVLAAVPMFNQPSAVAQSEGGGIGACNTAHNGCLEITSDDCAGGFGGLWYGEGSFCLGGVPCDSVFSFCPTRSVACCLGNGTCVSMFPDLCLEAGGTLPLSGTPCSQAACPQPCYGDVDGDGMVGINDFLDLLGAWGDCK